MNVSIASYAFHGLRGQGKMDIFGYLESMKYRYRLDAADIWNGTLGSTDGDHLRKVREALDEREMTLANLCVDGAHLWDPDPDTREQLHQNALAHLRAGVVLGAKTVRIDMGGQGNEMSNEQFDLTVSRYREYCNFAADHGFKVGPETHWGPSLTPAVQEKVYRAVDHPAYGILLHIGHWEGGPEAEEAGDRMAASWAMHTHVDARITAGCLAEKMALLRDAGYQGYWGIEHHSGANEYAEVAWQLAEVQRVLGRWRSEVVVSSRGV
ncbi:MAG: sugar phosphate isomerase/epimerase family protein [Armatimonadota bacterium]